MKKIKICTSLGDTFVITADMTQAPGDAVKNALQNIGLNLGYLESYEVLD